MSQVRGLLLALPLSLVAAAHPRGCWRLRRGGPLLRWPLGRHRPDAPPTCRLENQVPNLLCAQ